jgi:homoserine dehydrogenase
MKTVSFCVAGLGTVGGGLIRLWNERKADIRRALGIDLRLSAVADLDRSRAAGLPLKGVRFEKDCMRLPSSDSDICVELIGGTRVSREFVLSSLRAGKDVVSANKALLAERYAEIFSVAGKFGRTIGFEASVAGGIPIIKVLRESFLTSRVRTIYGILNGTTNYILTRMQEDGQSFAEALRGAQKRGFAEADPTLDIDGIDAAHKAALLANLAFGIAVKFSQVRVEGIRGFDLSDIRYASELGYVVKLLAVARRDAQGSRGVEVYVSPALLPSGHLLASVRNEFNAVYVDSSAVGETVFYGRGAGAAPTANSVLSDILDIASGGTRVAAPVVSSSGSAGINLNIINRYYLRFMTLDKPGVLGRIAGILGSKGISIHSCVQKESSDRTVPVVMTTHACRQTDLETAVERIVRQVKTVRGRPVVLAIR